jgi:hypothetical protein
MEYLKKAVCWSKKYNIKVLVWLVLLGDLFDADAVDIGRSPRCPRLPEWVCPRCLLSISERSNIRLPDMTSALFVSKRLHHNPDPMIHETKVLAVEGAWLTAFL